MSITLTLCDECGQYVSPTELNSSTGHVCNGKCEGHSDEKVGIRQFQKYHMLYDKTCNKIININRHESFEQVEQWAKENLPNCEWFVAPYYYQ